MEILVVGGQPPARGLSIVISSLQEFAHVSYQTGGQALKAIGRGKFDFTVLDETSGEDIPALIVGLKASSPATWILVTSPSPSWRDARAAFRSGAVEYIGRDVPQSKLFRELERVIDRIMRLSNSDHRNRRRDEE